MRILCALAALLILDIPPAFAQAASIAGDYRKGDLTIRIEPLSSAWRVKCVHNDSNPVYNDEFTYWDFEPFGGKYELMITDYECSPKEDAPVQGAFYRVTVAGPRKLNCSLFGTTMGLRTKDGIDAYDRNRRAGRLTLENSGTLGVDAPDPVLPFNECDILKGKYHREEKKK